MTKAGYTFLHILSAEGRHSPANAHITGEEYEASRLRTLDMLLAGAEHAALIAYIADDDYEEIYD